MAKKYEKSVYKNDNKLFKESLKILYKMISIELKRTEIKTLFKKDFSLEKSFGDILAMLKKSGYPQIATQDEDVLNELARIDYHIIKTIRFLKEELMTQSFSMFQVYVNELVELFTIRDEISKNSSEYFEEKKFFEESDCLFDLIQKRIDKVESNEKINEELKEEKLLELKEKREEFVEIRQDVCTLLEKSFGEDDKNKELTLGQRRYGKFNLEKIKSLERQNLPEYYRKIDARIQGYYVLHNEKLKKFCQEIDGVEKVAEQKTVSKRKNKVLQKKKRKLAKMLDKLIDYSIKYIKKFTPLKTMISPILSDQKAKSVVEDKPIENNLNVAVEAQQEAPVTSGGIEDKIDEPQVDTASSIISEDTEIEDDLMDEVLEEEQLEEETKVVTPPPTTSSYTPTSSYTSSSYTPSSYTPIAPKPTSSYVFPSAKKTTPVKVRKPVKKKPQRQEKKTQSYSSPFIPHVVFRILIITFLIFLMVKTYMYGAYTTLFIILTIAVGLLGFSTKSNMKNKHLDIRFALFMITDVVIDFCIGDGFWATIIAFYALGALLDGVFGKKCRRKTKHVSLYVLYGLLIFLTSIALSNWFMIIFTAIICVLNYLYEQGNDKKDSNII
ncbi:MAG: hypothetical protein J6V71_00360 [Clostridia bacterium]|nr:hypothetical protein [Clostridia bacterium]